MIKVTVICAGRVKESYYKQAAAEYIKRLGAYCEVELIEVREERVPDSPSQAQIDAALGREAALISAKIPKNAHVFAMCVEGDEKSSEALSKTLAAQMSRGMGLCYIIGSSNGLHDSVKSAANARLSMSKMTLPHSLARVMLLEQLYRALNFSAGGKYHK